jgi:transposase
MNCYGTLPGGSGQYRGGFRLPFTYLRITTASTAFTARRIFTVVIFFVRGLPCRRTMATANYVEELIKLSEGKNSLYVPRIVVKKA